MAILKKLYPAILALALTACYEDFTPQTDCKPVLCMNSLITAGEPLKVSVTRSWVYTDIASEHDHNVENVKLSIYANGELRDATYIPREGDRIRLIAESPGYEPAEAEVTVPTAVQFSNIEWKPILTGRWNGENIDGDISSLILNFDTFFTLTISDLPDDLNFYQFTYSNFYHNDGSHEDLNNPTYIFETGQFDYESEPIFSEHIGAFESVMGSTAWRFSFFTDRQFSGKDYTMHVNFTSGSYYANLSEFDDSYLDCGIILTLSSVSESFYNYANYKWQLSEGFIYDMSDIGLSDPIWGYSNVSTGAGIVAAKTLSNYRFNFKDFIISALETN